MVNFSTSEVTTGGYWQDGSTPIYHLTVDLADATGSTSTGIDKDYNILRWGLIERTPTGTFINRITPTQGATYWEVDITGAATQTFFWADYIKISI